MRGKRYLLYCWQAYLLTLLLHSPSRAQYAFQWEMGSAALGLYQLASPLGVAVDGQNNAYIADQNNHRVVKLSPAGQLLTTIGTRGTGNGQFDTPGCVALDAQGNIYVTDKFNNRVQKFSASGQFLLTFGSSGTNNGQFSEPAGIAVDHQGNIFVSDIYADRIQKFSPTGQFLLKFGSSGAGSGQLNFPSGLGIDAQGDIYVADEDNHRIQKFSATGQYIAKFGTNGSATGQFVYPSAVAFDSQGTIYVADTHNNRIQVFSPAGQYLSSVGVSGSGNGQLSFPAGLGVDSQGNIYVTDRGNNRVQKFTGTGQFAWNAGTATANGQFNNPSGMGTDSQGNIYVTDTQNHRIQKFSSTGQFLLKFGSQGTGNGQFDTPTGLAVDPQGNLFVIDSYNYRIQKLSSSGQYLAQYGSLGTADGQFITPTAITLDGQGNFYVTDSYNDRVQKFSPSGQFLLKFGTSGSGDGELSYPSGVAVDHQGNIYVTDLYDRIQQFSPSGQFVAKFGTSGSGNGQFQSPAGVAVDAQGNIFVVDAGNNRMQKFSPAGLYLDTFGSAGAGEGQFNEPASAIVDSQGNVYVTDKGNHRIQKFSPLPEIAVKSGAGSIADNTGSFSLGTTTYGNPVSQTFTLENTLGTGPLLVSNLSLPTGFSLAGNFPASIAPGTTANFTISLNANSTGSFTGTLSFNTNDADENPFNFTVSGTVNKANQAITFGSLVNKNYGDAPFALTATASSSLPVTYQVMSGPATLNGNTLTLTGAGLVTVKASQPGNTNYNAAAEVTQSFTVNKGTQTISFNSTPNEAEIGESITLAASASSGLAVSYALVSGPATLNGNTIVCNGEGSVSIKASQAGNADYNPASSVTHTITVSKVSQTITFNPITDKTYGEAPFEVSATASSSLPVSFSTVSGPAAVTGNTVTVQDVGTVIMKAYQTGNNTYQAVEVTQSFNVNKVSQTITFEPMADKILGDAPFNLSATASSSLAVSFTIVSGPATLNGNTISLTGMGLVTVSASQPGDARTSPATPVIQSFCVTPGKPAIMADGEILTSSATTGNQWYLDGQAIAGATSQQCMPLVPGSYSVKVTGPCGGAATSDAFAVTVAATENPLADLVELYPNPATVQVILVMPVHVTVLKATVVDVQGRPVPAQPSADGNRVLFPTAALSGGMYFLRIQTREGEIVKKFVVQ